MSIPEISSGGGAIVWLAFSTGGGGGGGGGSKCLLVNVLEVWGGANVLESFYDYIPVYKIWIQYTNLFKRYLTETIFWS